MARIGITNYYVNTIVTALQSSEWECLLQRYRSTFPCGTFFILPSMGAEVMLHILINTSIFIALPNDCLCQVTGIPLQPPPRPSRQKKTESAGPTLRAKRKAQDSDLLPTKRVKLLSGVYGLPSHQIQAQQTAKCVAKLGICPPFFDLLPQASSFACFDSPAPYLLQSTGISVVRGRNLLGNRTKACATYMLGVHPPTYMTRYSQSAESSQDTETRSHTHPQRTSRQSSTFSQTCISATVWSSWTSGDLFHNPDDSCRPLQQGSRHQGMAHLRSRMSSNLFGSA